MRSVKERKSIEKGIEREEIVLKCKEHKERMTENIRSYDFQQIIV